MISPVPTWYWTASFHMVSPGTTLWVRSAAAAGVADRAAVRRRAAAVAASFFMGAPFQWLRMFLLLAVPVGTGQL